MLKKLPRLESFATVFNPFKNSTVCSAFNNPWKMESFCWTTNPPKTILTCSVCKAQRHECTCGAKTCKARRRVKYVRHKKYEDTKGKTPRCVRHVIKQTLMKRLSQVMDIHED